MGAEIEAGEKVVQERRSPWEDHGVAAGSGASEQLRHLYPHGTRCHTAAQVCTIVAHNDVPSVARRR